LNKPEPINVVLVFGDQHRAQSAGFASRFDPTADQGVLTPVMDRMASEGITFSHAVSCAPVCSPYRASLLTGQYPLTHGVFVNDVNLGKRAVSLAQAFDQAGYDTAYIGKWHLDGHGRSAYIPPERRQGFGFWQVLECTHDYNHSYYYDQDDPSPKEWDGYDALAQTKSAQEYIRTHSNQNPFLLVLSWGPPHNPYETAPEQFQQLYDPATISLRSNVVEQTDKPYRQHTRQARTEIAGYYAHISALDHCLGLILDILEEQGIAENTLFIYTSDHGDMLWSHGEWRKQWPMDESIRVPFLMRCPALFGREARLDDLLLNTPDIMPTLLGLTGIPVPGTVEGIDYASAILGTNSQPRPAAALIECIHPFSEFQPAWGGREYRGIRTHRYTYVRDLHGPWLLFDNLSDPYQLTNMVGTQENREIQASLDSLLSDLLSQQKDAFLPGIDYMRQWGYPMDPSGAVPFDDQLYNPK